MSMVKSFGGFGKLGIPDNNSPSIKDPAPSLAVNDEEDTEVNPTKTLWDDIMSFFN
jgi:hypothetical protein